MEITDDAVAMEAIAFLQEKGYSNDLACSIQCDGPSNEAAARAIHPSGDDEEVPSNWLGKHTDWCQTIDQVTVELIGTAAPGTPEGVVLASFNAG